jgi:hypothetical protein
VLKQRQRASRRSTLIIPTALGEGFTPPRMMPLDPRASHSLRGVSGFAYDIPRASTEAGVSTNSGPATHRHRINTSHEFRFLRPTNTPCTSTGSHPIPHRIWHQKRATASTAPFRNMWVSGR